MGKKIGVYFRGKREGGSVIPSRLLKKNIDLFATFYIVKLNGFSDDVFISSANPWGGGHRAISGVHRFLRRGGHGSLIILYPIKKIYKSI